MQTRDRNRMDWPEVVQRVAFYVAAAVAFVAWCYYRR